MQKEETQANPFPPLPIDFQIFTKFKILKYLKIASKFKYGSKPR